GRPVPRRRYITFIKGESGETIKRHNVLHQTLLVMKLTILLLTVGMLNVSAKGLSQQITFSGKNVPMELVFQQIKAQTGYVVFYKKPLIRDFTPVTIDAHDLPLEIFLTRLFA